MVRHVIERADVPACVAGSDRPAGTPRRFLVDGGRGTSTLGTGLVERLPQYDTQSDVEHLKRLPSDGIVGLIRNATLRDADLISKTRDVAELWHWRSRARQLQESGRPVQLPNDLTLRDVVRMAAEKAAADGLFETALAGDFPAFGRPYVQLTADEWSEVNSIAMERHKVLNWLCGHAPANKWEDTPTDT